MQKIKSMKTYISILLSSIILVYGCKKKSAPPPNTDTQTSIKVTMSADKTTIRLGQESVITASVQGVNSNSSYQWEVNTISNLLGSGNTVTFSPCCSSVAGENIIKCTVTDSKGNKGVGQISIMVNP